MLGGVAGMPRRKGAPGHTGDEPEWLGVDGADAGEGGGARGIEVTADMMFVWRWGGVRRGGSGGGGVLGAMNCDGR